LSTVSGKLKIIINWITKLDWI